MRTPNRINNLSMDMIKRTGRPPKLRAKGGETRNIAPFALEVAIAVNAFKKDEHSASVLKCISGLMDLYMTFGLEPYPIEIAKAAVQRTAMAYVDLHNEATDADISGWAIKPKFHLFMELGEFCLEDLGDPSAYWAYKDED